MTVGRILRERLRNVEALRSVRYLYYVVGYRVWSALVRIRRDRVLFLSDSSATYTGNLAYLRDEILSRPGHVQVDGVFKPTLRSRRSLRDVLRLPFLMATSATIVLDDFYPLIYPIALRDGTRLVQVWHAAGALKRVGHSRAGLPGGPGRRSRIHRNYSWATVSSEAVRADYAAAFGIDVSRVLALGVPRTDALFDDAALVRSRVRIRARLGVADDVRLVCFAPTFRGNGQVAAYAGTSVDWDAVAAELGEGWRIVLRWHPFTAGAEPAASSEVLDASIGYEMNELLAAADVLVTDYSSAVFEFALLRRPVVFHVPDLDDYEASRSFYRPFDRYAIGPISRDRDELVAAIRSARVDDVVYDRFLDEFCDALDGRSSARIVDDLLLTERVDAARQLVS